MVITHFTFCGPYVECRVQKTSTTFQVKTCPNTSCEQHLNEMFGRCDKFCPTCGSAIGEVTVEQEVDAVNSWELEEKLGCAMIQPFGDHAETLSEQGLHIWIGCGMAKGAADEDPDSVDDDDDEESLREVRPDDLASELEKFSSSYKGELDQLRAAYGCDKVTVKWGVIQCNDY